MDGGARGNSRGGRGRAADRLGDLSRLLLRRLAPTAHPARLHRARPLAGAGLAAAGAVSRRAARQARRAGRGFHTPGYVAALRRAEADGGGGRGDAPAPRARHPLEPRVPRSLAPARHRGRRLAAGGRASDDAPAGRRGCTTPPAAPITGCPTAPRGSATSTTRCWRSAPCCAWGPERVAYVDIDAHHPDGVELAFGGGPARPDGLAPRGGALAAHQGRSGMRARARSSTCRCRGARGMRRCWRALDAVIGPRVEAHRPGAVVAAMRGGTRWRRIRFRASPARAARISPHVLRALMRLAPRLLLLGGGGYNPWSVGRLWDGGLGHALGAGDAGAAAGGGRRRCCAPLRWERARLGLAPPEHWFTTLVGRAAGRGELGAELRGRIASLARR